MAVNLEKPEPSALHPVPGLRIGVAQAGIRKPGRDDLLLMVLDEGANVAGVFTQNRFCAAPVQLCRQHLNSGAAIRAILVNTGNANAGTGEDGMRRARSSCVELAQHMGIAPEQVLPFSTGVIMEPLPLERLLAGLPAALAGLSANNWFAAAGAIMTTDTDRKSVV